MLSMADYLSFSSTPFDYLLWVCTGGVFVLAWVAFRRQVHTDKQASRVSLL